MVRKSAQSRHSTRLGSRRSLLRRRGPVPLADDSWDDTLAIPRPQIEAPRGRTGRYRWVIAAGGIGSIVVLATLAVAPTPGFVAPDTPSHGSTEDGAVQAGPGMAALHSMPASPSDTPSDGSTGAAPPFSADAGDSSGPGTGPGGSSGPPPPTGTTLPPPALVVEAESGILAGSAVVTADASASGGAYVGGIGDWGEGGPGSLVFASVNLPSTGTWRLTIYFLNAGPKGPRHGTVAVSGASPSGLLFAGSSGCCSTRTLDLSVSAGAHSVTITNPDDMGPSIDRLTFTLLPPV